VLVAQETRQLSLHRKVTTVVLEQPITQLLELAVVAVALVGSALTQHQLLAVMGETELRHRLLAHP
jgi:hypothetical protein